MNNAPFAPRTLELQRHHEKRFIGLMIYLAEHDETPQPDLPYCILTQERMMIYVRYLLAWKDEDTGLPRFLHYNSFRHSITNFFR